MEQEIWKDIPNYEGLYQVSNLGRIKSLEKFVNTKGGKKRLLPCKILKNVKDGRGYLKASLSKNCIPKNVLLHRIIANAFIPNPDNKPYINHINSNGEDNRIENLEWVTPKENVEHCVRMGRLNSVKNHVNKSYPILQYSLDGKLLNEYPSAQEAFRQTGISQAWINACAYGGKFRIINGVRKFIKCNKNGGYVWKFKKDIKRKYRSDTPKSDIEHWQQVKQYIEDNF